MTGADHGPDDTPHHGHAGHGEPEEHAAGGREHHGMHAPETFRNRFLVSLVLTLPILYYAEHMQAWFGYDAVPFPGSTLVGPIIGTLLYVYGGGVFLRGAWDELAMRAPGMMTLIGLAITVAWAYSIAVTLGFPGEPFYWELATLIVVMLLGHWVEMRSVTGAGRALEHLATLLPPVAHRVTGETTEDVGVDALADGDVVVVRPGEQVPADGVVAEGASTMNEAFLTGESRPVPKGEGDEVVAGAVNQEGALRVRVTRTGEGTTLNQMLRLVEDAQEARSRFQHLGDRAAYWLVLVAITAGAITFGAWLLAGVGATFAIARAVTVLVITCPHALGLAIPLVTVNATSLSAQNGILVRNREAFERARNVTIMAFDKTGTLTEGAYGVRAVHANGLDEADALALAAALERDSEHPLARAVVDEAKERAVRIPGVREFQAVAGQGVAGVVDGTRYRVGRPEWADELDVDVPAALRDHLEEAAARGEGAVVLMDDARALAVVTLSDRVRESARAAVRALRDMNVRVVMITGDADAVARAVSTDLGVDEYHARVLPEDKSRKVRALRERGPVAFVGDGINDAPALLEADLGVAIGAGTNVAIESADLVLVENDPVDAVRALRLARATWRKMGQNLFWATGYNVVAIPLAAGVAYAWGVILTPAVGALFMSVSTVIVAVNAMLLRRVRLS